MQVERKSIKKNFVNELNTCVSVRFRDLARLVLFATDRYFPRSNSPAQDKSMILNAKCKMINYFLSLSRTLICVAENAVLGRFFLSSSMLSDEEKSAKRCQIELDYRTEEKETSA